MCLDPRPEGSVREHLARGLEETELRGHREYKVSGAKPEKACMIKGTIVEKWREVRKGHIMQTSKRQGAIKLKTESSRMT